MRIKYNGDSGRKRSVKAAEQGGNTKFRIDIYKKDNHDALVKREYKSFDSKEEAKKYGQSIADGNIVEVMEVKASRSSRRRVTAARKKYDTNKAIDIFYESLENLNKFFKGTCMFRHTVGSVYMPDYAAYYEDDGYDFLKDLSALIKDNSSQAIMEWIEKYETNPLYLAVVNGTEDEYIQEHISGEDMNNIDPTVAEGFVDEWYNAFYNDCYKLGHEVADSICNFLSYFSESVEEADGSYDYQNDFYEMQINYFGDTVTSSTNRKAVKASRRAIMAGPGAGYTIKWNLESIKSINSFNVTNVSEPDQYGLITAEADCDVDITVEIVEAYSYYYGIDSPLNDVPAKMTKVKFEIDPEQWPEIGSLYDADVAFAEELLNNEIYDVVSNGEVMYGGGWTHSTWDGTLTDYDHDDLIEVKVTDEEIIQYVDDAVSGELDGAYDGVEESKRINSAKSSTRTPIKSSDFEFVYDEDDEDYDDGDLSGYYSYDDLTPEQQDYAVSHWGDFSRCANTIYDWFNEDIMDFYHEDKQRIAEEFNENYGFDIKTDELYWGSSSQGPYPEWDNEKVFGKVWLANAGNLSDVDVSFGGSLTVDTWADYYVGEGDNEHIEYDIGIDELTTYGADEEAVKVISNLADGAQKFIDEIWNSIEETCRAYPDEEWVKGIFEGNPSAFTFVVDENGDIEDIT